MVDVIAYAFAPDGTPEELSPKGRSIADLLGHAPEGGFVWIHANRGEAAGRDWMDGAGLASATHDALVQAETRPRCTVQEDGVHLNLRGVNLNPGAEADDMVSLRFSIAPRLVVTVQFRRIYAVSDVLDGIARGQGPGSPGELVARLALRLADRAEPVVAELNETLDDLEDIMPDLESSGITGLRGDLGELRSTAITLRRFMFPQRDALSTLEIEDLPWLSKHDRARLREATERVTRLAEELDAIRDRAQVVQDQLIDLRSEQMNRQMLLLSVVSAIFLPLGFLTGLLGINVGGMPGAGSNSAFWVVCGLLVVIALGLAWLFRKLGLLGR